MKKLLLTMLIAVLFAGSIRADEPVQRVVTIKNGNRNGILHTISDLVGGSPVRVSTSDNDHIVLAGPKDMVTGFEEVIKQLDIPPAPKKDIETTVYMVVATPQAGDTTTTPAELDPVIKQIKAIFNYKSFRLLESFVLRSRDGENGNTSGSLLVDAAPGTQKVKYGFSFTKISLDGPETSRSVRFERLSFSLDSSKSRDAEIHTDVDVPEGKKVVVGKTSGALGDNSALILVISAKVVD